MLLHAIARQKTMDAPGNTSTPAPILSVKTWGRIASYMSCALAWSTPDLQRRRLPQRPKGLVFAAKIKGTCPTS
jgi:hypothetical protein